MAEIDEIINLVNKAISIRYSDTKTSLKIGVEILEWAQINNAEKEKAYAHAIIGFAKNLQYKQNEGIKHLFDALSYFENNTDEIGYVLTANSLANYYDILGNYNKALQYVNNGYKAANKNKFDEFEADLLTTRGLIYSRISDYDKALESHKKALSIRKKLNLIQAVASSLNLIARTNLLSKNYSESEKYYKQSIVLRQKHNDSGGLVWSYIGIASMFIQTSEIQNAISYYFKAQELNSDIKDPRANFLIKKGIAQTYLLSKQFSSAKEYLEILEELANDLKSKPLLFQAYQILSEYYDAIGDSGTALQFYKDYTKTKEEVINEKTLNTLQQQQAAFEIEQSKKEAEIHRLKNVELKKAYKEIKDSINYAEKIQKSLLPDPTVLDKLLSEYFILFKPKDVVSGDYYWFKQINNHLIITAADCTGHGVPGAFMSMLGISFLNEIVSKNKFDSADLILNRLRDMVKNALKQKGDIGKNKDGMDIALCVINLETLELQFSGAYNPLYLIRKNELIQIKSDRQPIAVFIKENPFTLHNYQLKKDDCLYMFSDGYADQFGGPNDQKFMSKNLRNLLLEINEKPMDEQKLIMEKTFNDWKKGSEQMDDVIVIGLKI